MLGCQELSSGGIQEKIAKKKTLGNGLGLTYNKLNSPSIAAYAS
jgi:hypothetical protein